MRLQIILLITTISAMNLEPVLYRAPQQKPGEEVKSSMCWPRHPNLRRVSKSDCNPLVDSLKSLGKKGALIHFSKDENRGYKLPHRLRSGTCYIELNFIKAREVGPETEDDATFDEVIDTVETVIRLCVERPDSGAVGGGYIFGKQERMSVFVEGRAPTTETKKNYLPTELPVTRPPRKAKVPQKFQSPPRPLSQVHDTPHGVVLELPFSIEQLEEQQRQMDLLAALQQKPHKPKSVLSP